MDDGAGLVYFDWVSRVVLARESHDRPMYAPAGDLGAPERAGQPRFSAAAIKPRSRSYSYRYENLHIRIPTQVRRIRPI